MLPHFFWCGLAVLAAGTCLAIQPERNGHNIELFRVKEFSENWLKEVKGPNVSGKVDKLVLELWGYQPGKAMPELEEFEKAILQGKPLDPERAALLICLNCLAETNQKLFIDFGNIYDRDKPFGGFLHKTAKANWSDGGYTSGIDFSAAKKMKDLGKVSIELDILGKLDMIEESKEKPEVGRLTLQAVLTVNHKDTTTKYQRDLGQYRLSSEDRTELGKLPKWK